MMKVIPETCRAH